VSNHHTTRNLRGARPAVPANQHQIRQRVSRLEAAMFFHAEIWLSRAFNEMKRNMGEPWKNTVQSSV
jgi:hypothetical protein